MRFATSLLLVLLLTVSARGQSFVVEDSRPRSGAAGIPLSKTVAFAFSERVSIATDWNTAFVSAPRDSIHYSRVSLCLNLEGACGGGNDVSRYVRFEVQHQPDTDYTWMIHAVETPAGEPMDVPYVLRYTTAPTMGPHHLAGEVRSPISASKRSSQVRTTVSALAQRWRRGERRALFGRSDSQRDSAPPANGLASGALRAGDQAPVGAHVEAIGKTEGRAEYTRVLLLGERPDDVLSWSVQAADVIAGSSGPYTVEYLRDGVYWPVGVRYTGPSSADVDALGFYDADGDGDPDSVRVDGDSVPNIDVQLYEFFRSSAREGINRSRAVESAAAHAPDQELKMVEAGPGLQPDGSAYEWTYSFYSPSKQRVTRVTVNPIDVTATTATPVSTFVSEMAALPASYIDSREALRIALEDGGQAFLDPYPSRSISATLQGGNLYWLAEAPTSNAFWRIQLQARTSTSVHSFERFVDMETGAVLDPETLPVELTSFTAQIEDPSTIRLAWSTASETNNAGFEVHHQVPGRASAWRTLAFVQGAGTTAQPKHYRYRLTGATPGTHRFRLKQLDVDGTAAFSAIIEANVRIEVPYALESQHPNPLPAGRNAGLLLTLRETQPVTATLYNTLGQRVHDAYAGIVEAHAPTRIDLSTAGLSSGLYLLHVHGPRFRATHRLTVVR